MPANNELSAAAILSAADKMNVAACQQKLFDAMLQNDYATIESLYHDKLIFTNSAGQAVGKAPEVERYRSGHQSLKTFTPVAEQIEIYGNIAVITVETMISGAFLKQTFNGNFRYQHTWRKFRSNWKVICGCCVQVI